MPFAVRMLELLPDLATSGEGMPLAPASVDALEEFQSMDWDFSEGSWSGRAGLASVVRYLRGNLRLRIPASWRAVFPTRL